MFAGTFIECSGLTGGIPEKLFAGISGAPAEAMFSETFWGCSGLTGSIPESLFAGINGAPADLMFIETFWGCSGLTGNIPEKLFAGIRGAPAGEMFYSTFEGCSGLTGYVPFRLFRGIDGIGISDDIDGFVEIFDGATSMDTECPDGLKSVTKPSSDWGDAAFCRMWIECSAGYYSDGTQCVACGVGSYSEGGAEECIACGDGGNWGLTTTGPGQTSCNAVCANAVDSNGDDAVKGWLDAVWNPDDNTVTNLCVANSCLGGQYGHYLDDGNCLRCDSLYDGTYPSSPYGGTNSGAGACYARSSDMPGFYITGNMRYECPVGTYKPGTDKVAHIDTEEGAKWCQTCPDNTYAEVEGSQYCTSCLENYTTFGEKTSASACRIMCRNGYYLANENDTTCSPVGAGFWAQQSFVTQGNVGERNKCDGNMTTIGYGAGADEAADCGFKLHIGDDILYLRGEKRTHPALAVKVGDNVFYGNMSLDKKYVSDGASKSLRVMFGDNTYSVYDDSAENYVGKPSEDVQDIVINPALVATSIVPATYNDASDMDWSATLSDGTVLSGVGKCDATTDVLGGLSADGFEPSGNGTGCWCMLMSPTDGKKWVYTTANASCDTKCGYYCANNMKGNKAKNIGYRTSLYQSAGIKTE